MSKLAIALALGIAASIIGTCVLVNRRKQRNVLDEPIDLDLALAS